MGEHRPTLGSADPAAMDDAELLGLVASALADPSGAGGSPADLLRLVAAAPTAQVATVMASEVRDRALDEVFVRMSEFVRPEKAGSRRSVVHWRITGRPDGGCDEFTTVIDRGTCTAQRGLVDEPRVVITTGPVELLKLVSGSASGPMLFMTRKLKIAGDVGYAAGLTSIFEIPTA